MTDEEIDTLKDSIAWLEKRIFELESRLQSVESRRGLWDWPLGNPRVGAGACSCLPGQTCGNAACPRRLIAIAHTES